MTTRTITGTIRKPDGTAWASATVTFKLQTNFATATDATIPHSTVTATTDVNGDFSVSLEVPATNAWRWHCILPDNSLFAFNFGAGPTTTLHALIADANLSDTVTPSALADAIAEKADKITPAATNNIAVLDANGNLADGGSTIADVSAAEDAYNTLADGATTADASVSKKHKTANTGATSFTGFTGHSDGDRLFYFVDDANTTLVHNASSFYLSGRQNVTPDSGTLLAFVSDGTIVREIGRRVFDLADTADITWAVNGNDYEASLSNTGVTPGSYTNASVTVDGAGRVTAASSGSGFDNQVPLDIDLDTPNTTGSVVATFTADGSATAAILEAYKGATMHAQITQHGQLVLTADKTYSNIGGDVHTVGNASSNWLIDTSTPASNAAFFEVYAQTRLTSGDVSSRNLNGMNVIAIIPNTSSNTITGTGALQGGRLVAQYDKSSGTTSGTTGFTLLVGASRAGGTVTTAKGLETQVFSTGTVTTGYGLYVKSPTTPANVTTSKGIYIEAQDVDIESVGGVVILSNLPTSDPTNAGQLWNDSGTLKVSAG